MPIQQQAQDLVLAEENVVQNRLRPLEPLHRRRSGAVRWGVALILLTSAALKSYFPASGIDGDAGPSVALSSGPFRGALVAYEASLAVRFMLLFSPRWLFFYPGVLLMSVGLLATAALVHKPQTFASVTFGVQTLLYAVAAFFLGFEAVLFDTFARVFAITSGLLPATRLWRRLFEWSRLEVGLAAGGALFLAGLLGSAGALRAWSLVNFGGLPQGDSLRLVIPSVAALVLGCQVVMASFFLSILGLQRK